MTTEKIKEQKEKQILNIPITEITNIIHISDIHIRQLKRHKEYCQVFEKLYKEVKKIITPTTVIFITGDIVHSKVEMSPELINLMGDFFKNLAELGPVIVIAGNHDANLSNSNRLDAISPVISLMNENNIFYLKNSGVYAIGNTDISVMSVFDSVSSYVQAKDLDGKFKIAVYHGALNQSKTDMGFVLSEGLNKDFFTGFDVVLLGDIHRNQIIQEYKEEELEIEEKDLKTYLKDGWEIV